MVVPTPQGDDYDAAQALVCRPISPIRIARRLEQQEG
jgi:hypothetical protein